jgi:hypothetical protein
MRSSSKSIFLAMTAMLMLALVLNVPAPIKVAAQQPTGSVPTVTSTPGGPFITVTYDPQINVRAGPNSQNYPLIGLLLVGETRPALGRSAFGDWIMIRYIGVPGDVGWVFSSYVSLSPGADLPIVEAPATATPATTPTINPTVAALFITPIPPTRLPTYTPPGPLQIPTYQSPGTDSGSSVPMGLVIVLLGLIGGFGAMISFLRGR